VNRAAALSAIVAMSLMTACGSDSNDKQASTQDASATATESQPVVTVSDAKPTHAEALAQCHEALDPLVDGLDDVEKVAKVGGQRAAYVKTLEKTRFTFRHLDIPGAPKPTNCLPIITEPAVLSLQAYIHAGQTWRACDKRKSCGDAAVAAKLRKLWKTASDQGAAAHKAFDKVVVS